MKKVFTLLFFLLSFSCFSTPFMVIYSTTQDNENSTSYLEYTFDRDGLINTIICYQIEDEVDFSKWNITKTKGKILGSYYVERNTEKVLLYECTNASVKLVKQIYLRDIANYDYKDIGVFYEGKQNADYYFVTPGRKIDIKRNILDDDVLVFREEDYKDSKLVFTEQNVYVSGYIKYSELAKRINVKLNPYSTYADFCLYTPIKQPDKYYYSDGKNEVLLTKNQLIVNGPEININLKNYKYGSFIPYIMDASRRVALLFKTRDFALVYTCDSLKPLMIGFTKTSNVEIIPIENVKSSSYLTQKKEYKPDNISKLELDSPWIEGASGNGIGEYIEFNKKDANCMYILNGYISWDYQYQYKQFNRAKVLEVRGLSSGVVKEFKLKDVLELQHIPLDSFSNERIRITIKDVYIVGDNESTCIAGIILVKE